jgi:hypothetical protein
MKMLLGSLALLVGLSFMGLPAAAASDQPTTVVAKDGDGDKDKDGKKGRHHRKHHRKHHHKRHHKHTDPKSDSDKK